MAMKQVGALAELVGSVWQGQFSGSASVCRFRRLHGLSITELRTECISLISSFTLNAVTSECIYVPQHSRALSYLSQLLLPLIPIALSWPAFDGQIPSPSGDTSYAWTLF